MSAQTSGTSGGLVITKEMFADPNADHSELFVQPSRSALAREFMEALRFTPELRQREGAGLDYNSLSTGNTSNSA